ncbi:MAG: ThiS protein [Osedax symbiont Rs1]|nr:MAG: ThiS protein [Osedax symbiont Rs1]
MFSVLLNNNSFEVESNCTLSQIIDIAGFAEQTIAVAINGEFVPKSAYTNTALQVADQIDIVKPIGGG